MSADNWAHCPKCKDTEPLTFREDYEIGIEGDEFEVIYKGKCIRCGLKYEHRFLENIVRGE